MSWSWSQSDLHTEGFTSDSVLGIGHAFYVVKKMATNVTSYNYPFNSTNYLWDVDVESSVTVYIN